MSNAIEGRQELTIAARVAYNLGRELDNQRWSARQAAFKLGLTPMYVTRRVSGAVECTASDLETFAKLLNVSIARFFELPDLDSNQEPAGFSHAPIRLVPRDRETATAAREAIVTPIRSHAS